MKNTIIFTLLLLTVIPVFSQNNASSTKGKKDKKDSLKKITDGFDKITWGTLLSNAKQNIRGKITYTDDREVIVSRDSELEYKYGFFFDRKSTEGKFFYLSISFPYLSFDEVRKKYETKYGSPTRENINKNQGAIAWDGEKTVIIMMVDRYEKKPYTKKIIYASKEIIKEVNEYHTSSFNSKEIETIKKMNP